MTIDPFDDLIDGLTRCDTCRNGPCRYLELCDCGDVLCCLCQGREPKQFCANCRHTYFLTLVGCIEELGVRVEVRGPGLTGSPARKRTEPR